MPPLEIEITDVAFGGSGVGRANGKATFVPFTIDGERVSIRIRREKKQFAEAELTAVLQPSPHRVSPECPYFSRCGGCSYQHIDYAHQLELKQHQVEQILRRIGRFTDPPVQTIVPSPKPYAYRNRITVHAEAGVIGYYRRDVHELIAITHCPIAVAEVNEELAALRARSPRDGHYSLRAHSGPRVFAQTNDAVAEALVQLIESWLPAGEQLLIDAYCGSGFFTKRLAHKFARVVGIEWDRFAVDAAQRDARPNESYIAGDVELELRAQLLTADLPQTTIIVDPPATGLATGVTQTLRDHLPATLIYVSCNPATLARDLRTLAGKFEIQSITPLDMFPQTAEIEVAVSLRALR